MEEKIIKIMQLVQIKKDNTVEFPEEARKLIREVAEKCRKLPVYKDNTDKVDTYKGKVIVESIKTSAKRTAIMVQHIDKMLDVYRIYCSKLSEKDKRRYKIIKALYISKTPMTIAEISKKFSVSKVTVYEDIKIAKERLSSLFFGIDGLRFF